VTTRKLSRIQLQKIVSGMTARDMIETMPEDADGLRLNSKKFVGAIFDAAAERQGFGEKALDRVGIGDAGYLSELLAGALNAGSPKADDTEELPPSAATGD
jgi:hypothetical protein